MEKSQPPEEMRSEKEVAHVIRSDSFPIVEDPETVGFSIRLEPDTTKSANGFPDPGLVAAVQIERTIAFDVFVDGSTAVVAVHTESAVGRLDRACRGRKVSCERQETPFRLSRLRWIFSAYTHTSKSD